MPASASANRRSLLKTAGPIVHTTFVLRATTLPVSPSTDGLGTPTVAGEDVADAEPEALGTWGGFTRQQSQKVVRPAPSLPAQTQELKRLWLGHKRDIPRLRV
jgi:hypothetical protein